MSKESQIIKRNPPVTTLSMISRFSTWLLFSLVCANQLMTISRTEEETFSMRVSLLDASIFKAFLPLSHFVCFPNHYYSSSTTIFSSVPPNLNSQQTIGGSRINCVCVRACVLCARNHRRREQSIFVVVVVLFRSKKEQTI